MFTREYLEGLTIRQMRLLDISNTEDEKLVQVVLNEKMGNVAPNVKINRSDVPDIKTPEEEAIWQQTLDRRTQAAKDRTLATELPGQGVVKNASDPFISEPQDDETEGVDHIVTQSDLDENPDLVEQGVKVGETIQLEKPTELLNETELRKLSKPAIIEYADKLGLVFNDDLVTNQIQRVDAVLEFQKTLEDK